MFKKIKYVLLLIICVSSIGMATVYEDSEDKKINGWRIYDSLPRGAKISNIFDSNRGNRVISLRGSKLDNGYKLGYNWNNISGKTLEWSMNYAEDFILYIAVKTIKGNRYLTYTNRDDNQGLIRGGKIHHGLGVSSANGAWKTFTRNLEVDLKEFDSDNSIIAINSFMIRGSGKVDDILITNDTSTPIPTPIPTATPTPIPTPIPTVTPTTPVLNRHTEIGPRKITPTPLSKGTKFVDPNGDGTLCTKTVPCSYQYAFSHVVSGDVVFIRGLYTVHNRKEIAIGVRAKDSNGIPFDSPFYNEGAPFDGDIILLNKAVIIESWPGEEPAVFDGGYTTVLLNKALSENSNPSKNKFYLIGDNYVLRNFEIKRMGGMGLDLRGNNIIVEGMKIHNNMLSGVRISVNSDLGVGRSVSNITIQDNEIYNNSDANIDVNNIFGTNVYQDGGNADGINLSNANKLENHLTLKNVKILHNRIYGNSDDGIDNYKYVEETEIAYNICYSNGKSKGDGHGIKFVGNLNNISTQPILVHHNIAYDNLRYGFSFNTGSDLIISYNTAWNNHIKGFGLQHPNNMPLQGSNNKFNNNISWGNKNLEGTLTIEAKDRDQKVGVVDNSWQTILIDNKFMPDIMHLYWSEDEVIEITVPFQNTNDSTASNFLRPIDTYSAEYSYGAYSNP